MRRASEQDWCTNNIILLSLHIYYTPILGICARDTRIYTAMHTEIPNSNLMKLHVRVFRFIVFADCRSSADKNRAEWLRFYYYVRTHYTAYIQGDSPSTHSPFFFNVHILNLMFGIFKNTQTLYYIIKFSRFVYFLRSVVWWYKLFKWYYASLFLS